MKKENIMNFVFLKIIFIKLTLVIVFLFGIIPMGYVVEDWFNVDSSQILFALVSLILSPFILIFLNSILKKMEEKIKRIKKEKIIYNIKNAFYSVDGYAFKMRFPEEIVENSFN